MSSGRFTCQHDGHDEDITSRVEAKLDAALEGQGRLTYKFRLGRKPKKKRLFVHCSLGHVNVIDYA